MTLISFPPSSALVTRVAPGLGFRTDQLKKREHDPIAIVVHTTGSGPVAKFNDLAMRARHGWKCPGDAAAWIYGNTMPESGHYVIDGDNGQLVQIVPEDHIAMHVGSGHFHAYFAAPDRWGTIDTHWWGRRWAPKHSPVELAGGLLWKGGSCNANTIGVEVAPRVAAPRGAWSPAAWAKLTALLREISARYHIPLDREHIVTHSDASPLSRSASDKPWDPYEATWTPELLEQHLHAS